VDGLGGRVRISLATLRRMAANDNRPPAGRRYMEFALITGSALAALALGLALVL
jgi:hypothetical protein